MARLSQRYAEAVALAIDLHADQKRKASDAPYVAHLLSTSAIVLLHGGSEDEAIAALLHDAIEDAGGEATRALVEARFGAGVANVVVGCTDAWTAPKPPWRPRKEAFLARLAGADSSVRLVVAADKFDNVRSLIADYARQGDDLWAFFKGGRDGTLWYYREVVRILAASPHATLTAELAAEVSRLAAAVNG